MDIDICRKCPCWIERIYAWNSVTGEKVCVEMKCIKFRKLRWNGNLEYANNGFLKKKCKEINRILLEYQDDGYMKALGEADGELHDKFGDAVNSHRIPSDCEMKFEYTMGKWNR